MKTIYGFQQKPTYSINVGSAAMVVPMLNSGSMATILALDENNKTFGIETVVNTAKGSTTRIMPFIVNWDVSTLNLSLVDVEQEIVGSVTNLPDNMIIAEGVVLKRKIKFVGQVPSVSQNKPMTLEMLMQVQGMTEELARVILAKFPTLKQ